jgi:hypothetical protein
MRVAAVIRPEGLAQKPKGQESLTQGLPWVSRNKRFALNGPGKRNVPALLTGEVNETRLTEEAKQRRFAYLPVGPFRVNRWGGSTQGKPWAMLSGHFGAQIGDVQTPSGLMTG